MHIHIIASEQTNTNEAIMQAVAEATRAAIQAMVRAERIQDTGSRLGRLIMKQPTFTWEAEDKYNKLKNFRLELNNIFKSYLMPKAEQIAIIKMARQKRPTIPRIINRDRARKM